MKQTVLDLIPVTEIETWKPGDHVLVIAGTGKCKTTWVKQVLWPYCKERGLSLYTLANRSMLRDDIQHGTDMPVLTYQLLEQHPEHPGWDADVIVMDECHSLATDVMLDYQRDMMLDFFQNQKTIIIGLTATPVDCVTALFDSDHVYQLPRDTAHIESVYVYHGVRKTPDILRAEMSKGGRVLCFVRSSQRGLDIHYEIDNTAFVCSKNAKQWTKEIEAHKQSISCKRHWGKAQALIATKVMDVGVSIEDPDVTSVIVETDDYTVDLIQMIGRIRCQVGQCIRVFICILPKTLYRKRRAHLMEALKFWDDYQQNPRLFAYTPQLFPRILTNGQINRMMYLYCKQLVADAENVIAHGAKAVLSKQLCGVALIEYREKKPALPAPHALRTKMVSELLGIIRALLGEEYPDRRELLQHFDGTLQADRHLLGLSSTRLTRKSINELLMVLGMPYQIAYLQYGKGPERGKHFCRIVKIEDSS